MKREKQNIIGQYDAACKELLSQKVILAWTMKGCLAFIVSIADECV